MRKLLAHTGKRWAFPLLLFGSVLLSTLLFLLQFRFDNKYTGAAPGRNGVMRIDAAAFQAQPVTFLVNGWELYRYRALSPEEIPRHKPDAFIYIGQYGGLELGDAAQSPYGYATYRLTVYVPTPGEYALELPEIYSTYTLWLNGREQAPASEAARRDGTLHTVATAYVEEKLEIVIAVENHTGFYSGLVYPPAFGEVGAVFRVLTGRAVLHGVVCALALLMAIFCLFFGIRGQSARAFRGMALLCGWYILYAGYPIVHMLGWEGAFWYALERVSYYAMIATAVFMQARLCAVPKKVAIPAGVVSILAAALAFFAQFAYAGGAKALYAISNMLMAYKWASALYLLAAAGYALKKGNARAKPLLVGFAILAAALLVDRILPMYEPVYGGYLLETAGLLLLCVIMGMLCADALHTYRENQAMAEKTRADALRIEALRERERLQKEYTEKTHILNHELRANALTMQTLLRQGAYGALEQRLQEITGALPGKAAARGYHPLLGAILARFGEQAEALDARVELRVEHVPEKLPIADADLAGLLMNMLDNALLACGQVESVDDRWIQVEILYRNDTLTLECRNARSAKEGALNYRAGRYYSTKTDGGAHGYGLRVMREAVQRYGGVLEISHDESSFTVYAALTLTPAPPAF